MPAFSCAGTDTEGKEYTKLDDMWKDELAAVDAQGERLWYKKAVDYWKEQPATVDGVLGGYGHVSDVDIKESAEFILPFMIEAGMTRERAIDLGAGVGRIAHNLLIKKLMFKTVDLLEPCAHMLDKARDELPADRVGEMVEGSVQTFDFKEATYDILILQWVGIYLTDADFVTFIQRALKSLRPNGIIFIKENTSSSGFIVDKDDSSLTRNDGHYRHLIAEGGGEVVKHAQQQDFPEELFKVFMYAVKPKA
eukprot:TRINITY_DN1039_c0_g3_i3.p1 TRINITY_DN1039_c0_g3~~TRINITY_DN1039_c0_g3_i3.p1  ORF type:complete len:251 (+),score=102.02 TRINITY_DN1039_c0_g3_i3:554-1306(+)